MRTRWLGLVLIGTGACRGPAAPPSASATSSSSTTAMEAVDSASTTGSTTHGDACPPMPPQDVGYDVCPGPCGDGQCLHEEDAYGVCTRGCFSDCDCWPAPADGSAPARCSSALLDALPVCVLDCSAGQTCPAEMICVEDLGICAYPTPSTGSTDGTMGSGSSGSSSTGSGSTGGIPPD